MITSESSSRVALGQADGENRTRSVPNDCLSQGLRSHLLDETRGARSECDHIRVNRRYGLDNLRCGMPRPWKRMSHHPVGRSPAYQARKFMYDLLLV